MEMDELQRAWGQLDARLVEQSRQLARYEHRDRMASVRARLRWLLLGQGVQLCAGVAIVLWAGGYWYDHRDQAHLVAYGLALHAYGLGFLIFAVTQLLLLASVDFQAAVLAVQRKLHQVARLRALSGRVMLAAGMVAWVPLFLVAMRGVGLDLWLRNPTVVWANLAVAGALVAGVEWFTRRYPERCQRGHVGAMLRRAEDELEALSGPGGD